MKKKPALPNFTGVKNNHLCAVKIVAGTSIKAWARKGLDPEWKPSFQYHKRHIEN